MPKIRKISKINGRVYKSNILRKFRIGTRQTAQSAIRMTNEALVAVLENKNQSKFHSNARTVLAMRGVTI